MVAEDGHTYERSAILEWFEFSRANLPRILQHIPHVKSPVSGVMIGDTIVPNHNVKKMIVEWK